MTVTINCSILRQNIEAHEEAINKVAELVEGMSDEQANWKPGPKKWSVAECLEHLNQGLRLYNEKMEPLIQKARDGGKTGSEPYKSGPFIGGYLVNFLRKGPSKKAPAPGAFKPATSGLKIDKVAADFRANAQKMTGLAEKADGLDLGRIRFGTPVSALIRLSMAQAFELHALHTPRHVAQATRVKQAEGFPG